MLYRPTINYQADHRAGLWESGVGVALHIQARSSVTYDWWNEADPPHVFMLIGTYSIWTINRTVIRHGVNAFTVPHLTGEASLRSSFSSRRQRARL